MKLNDPDPVVLGDKSQGVAWGYKPQEQVDVELVALAAIISALRELEPPMRARVIRWAADRWKVDIR